MIWVAEKAGAMLMRDLQAARHVGRAVLTGSRGVSQFAPACTLLETISKGGSIRKSEALLMSLNALRTAKSGAESATSALSLFDSALADAEAKFRGASGQEKSGPMRGIYPASSDSLGVMEAMVLQGRDGMEVRFSCCLGEVLGKMELSADDAILHLAARLSSPGVANPSNILVQGIQELKDRRQALAARQDGALRQAGEKLMGAADIALRENFSLPSVDTSNFDKMMSRLSCMPNGFLGM